MKPPSSRPVLRYFVQLQDRERLVEIQEEGSELHVRLDGVPVDANLTLLSKPSLHSLLLNGASREMVLTRKGDEVQVSLDGETLSVKVYDEVSRALAQFTGGAGTGAREVLAPMPGVVVSIAVKPGDVVASGQPVVILEAMKMQNELTAETDGIVERIEVSAGQSVAGGAVLVVLRAPEGS